MPFKYHVIRSDTYAYPRAILHQTSIKIDMSPFIIMLNEAMEEISTYIYLREF